MRLLGYTRVSTEGQAENTSLEEQKRKINGYCDLHGPKLVKVYTDIESGYSMSKRPQFQRAKEALIERKVDGIIAIKLDRIARNTFDLLDFHRNYLEPNRKVLVLIDTDLDTSTPTGKMMLTQLSSFAEFERDQIRERTQGGRKAKASKGGYAYGSPPYGWESINKVLVPVPHQQHIIQLLRRHRRSGKSHTELADWLNDMGEKTKRGKWWNASQVQRVLERKAAASSG
jgi:DNA invertase Pin-like site-specific DNA recombinase